MNKGRVEAFTDAVVAIILTIMVLEFKTPETAKWTGIIHQLPYFFAYIVSFLFVGVAWYNHHYMFALALRISKKVYWITACRNWLGREVSTSYWTGVSIFVCLHFLEFIVSMAFRCH